MTDHIPPLVGAALLALCALPPLIRPARLVLRSAVPGGDGRRQRHPWLLRRRLGEKRNGASRLCRQHGPEAGAEILPAASDRGGAPALDAPSGVRVLTHDGRALPDLTPRCAMDQYTDIASFADQRRRFCAARRDFLSIRGGRNRLTFSRSPEETACPHISYGLRLIGSLRSNAPSPSPYLSPQAGRGGVNAAPFAINY